MNNIFNKKMAELLSKMDEKVMQAKLNAAIEMLKKGNTDELARKINKMDKDELITKIDELDKSKLQELPINLEEIRQKITDEDLTKLASLIGEHGDEIIGKLKDIIK